MRKSDLIEEIMITIPLLQLIGALGYKVKWYAERHDLDYDDFRIPKTEEEMLTLLRSISIEELRDLMELAKHVTYEKVVEN
jgi:hypothetical protein